MPYSKNLKGDCEEDDFGKFEEIEDCQADQRSPVYEAEFDRWVAMQALIQDDDLFFELAPSDQREYVWQRFGLRLREEDDTREIGGQLIADDLVSLYLHSLEVEMIAEYLAEKLDELDMFLLKAVSESGYSGYSSLRGDIPVSLKWYRAHFHRYMLDYRNGGFITEDTDDTESARIVRACLTTNQVRFAAPHNTPVGIRVRDYIVSQLPMLRERYFG